MKTLVVYYSLEGNTRHIAEAVARQLQAELLELNPQKAYPTKGLQKYFWGGKSVVLGEQPDLTQELPDCSAYENIVIGTPVWAGSFSPPVNTFLHRCDLTGKKVALFACHAGGGAKRCFANLKAALPHSQFIGEIDFLDPLKKHADQNAIRAAQWAADLNLHA